MRRRRDRLAEPGATDEGRGGVAVVRIVPDGELWSVHGPAGLAELVGDLLVAREGADTRLVLDFRRRRLTPARRRRRAPVAVPELVLEFAGSLPPAETDAHLDAALAWLARGPREARADAAGTPALAVLRAYGPDGGALADRLVTTGRPVAVA